MKLVILSFVFAAIGIPIVFMAYASQTEADTREFRSELARNTGSTANKFHDEHYADPQAFRENRIGETVTLKTIIQPWGEHEVHKFKLIGNWFRWDPQIFCYTQEPTIIPSATPVQATGTLAFATERPGADGFEVILTGCTFELLTLPTSGNEQNHGNFAIN